MPDPLTETDIEAAFRRAVPPWFLDHLDTKLRTAAVVTELRRVAGNAGGCGPCLDGPYSDGGNPEWWSMDWTVTARGCEVQIRHEERAGPTAVLREGVVPWNALANRATLAALARRRQAPAVNEQLVLV